MKIKNKRDIFKKILIVTALFLLIAISFSPFIPNPRHILMDYNNSDAISELQDVEHVVPPEEIFEESEEKIHGNEEIAEQNDDVFSGTYGSTTENNKSATSNPGNNGNSSSSGGSGAVHTPSYPSLPSPPPVSKGKNIVGYYMGWSRYKGFNPEHMNTSKITHLNYAFADLKSDFSIGLADSSIDLKNFESLRNIKKGNSNFRTLISIGGWDYSKYFSNAALNSTNRRIFAQNCLNFILDHGFDGVDIDWEYPVSGGLEGNIHRPEDKQNFTLLLREIRNKLNEQSARDGKNYYLTAAVDPGTYYLNKVEIKNIASIVDYMFLMAYDYNGPWDKNANFNAPLYHRSDSPWANHGSIVTEVTAHLNSGVPASKMILGVPFYGYQYNVTSSSNNGIGSTFSSSSSISYDDVVSKYLNNAAFTFFFDDVARVPYLFGNNTFISFENEQSINEKVSFAKSKGLAGAGFWEASFDRSSKLLNVMHNLLK